MPVAELFQALGDPIRLEMVSRLSSGNTYTISSISSDLGMSRQGARKHLQVLSNAHIVKLEIHGRDTQVSLQRESFEQGKAFITELEQRWNKRLEKLRIFIEED